MGITQFNPCKKQQSNESNNVAISYFHLLKRCQQKSYDENLRSSKNVALCLDKKDFSTMITSTRCVDIDSTEKIMIDWYKYLYYYVYKQVEKNKEWANNILIVLDNEYFIWEIKFQSDFFYKEFEMNTKPKIIKKITEEVKGLKEEDYQPKNQQKHRMSITKNLGGSFGSQSGNMIDHNNNDNNIEAILPEDATVLYKNLRNQVKEYVKIFNQHIKDPEHPLNIITTIFCNCFSSYVQSEIIQLKEQANILSKNHYQETLFNKSKAITQQLQKIIIKLQVILKLFYSSTINYQCFIEERDELINLVTTLVFKNDNIYKAMYDLYELSEKERVKALEERFYKYQNVRPDDLKINVKFRLNESTLQYQKEIIFQRKVQGVQKPQSKELSDDLIKKINNKLERNCPYESLTDGQSLRLNFVEENIINLYENSYDPNTYLNHQGNIEDKIGYNYQQNFNIETTKTKLDSLLDKKQIQYVVDDTSLSYSYRGAIRQLESIKCYQTPFEKMMIISKLSEKITDSVDAFWKDLNKIVDSSFLSIDADNLIAIFIYIIIQSQMSDIPIHTRIIKNFTTSTTKSTMIGYYYTTLEASLDYIESDTLQPNKGIIISSDDEKGE